LSLAGTPSFSNYVLTQGSGFLSAVWKAIIQPWNCSCCTSSEGMPMNVELQNTLQISLMKSGTCTRTARTLKFGMQCMLSQQPLQMAILQPQLESLATRCVHVCRCQGSATARD